MPLPVKSAKAKSFKDGTYLYQGYNGGDHQKDVDELGRLYKSGKLTNPSKEMNGRMTEQLLLGQSAKKSTGQFIKNWNR